MLEFLVIVPLAAFAAQRAIMLGSLFSEWRATWEVWAEFCEGDIEEQVWWVRWRMRTKRVVGRLLTCAFCNGYHVCFWLMLLWFFGGLPGTLICYSLAATLVCQLWRHAAETKGFGDV